MMDKATKDVEEQLEDQDMLNFDKKSKKLKKTKSANVTKKK